MDNSTHALLMKQCFHCHHWALLTEGNWPKSSREDPCKSCCRKCHIVKKLPVEDGDSDEDGIQASLKMLLMGGDANKQNSSSSYNSCQDTASPPSMSGTVCSKEQEQATQKRTEGSQNERTDYKDEEQSSRSTMASRWACENPITTHQDKPDKTTVPPAGPKDWFKKRDDLCNGSATVNNASKELFSNAPRRVERKPKEVKKTTAQQQRKPILSPSTANNIVQPGRQQASKSAQLTGANLLAVGGDSGWADRSQRPVQLEKYTLSEGFLRRDLPPHMSGNNRMQDTRFDASKENAYKIVKNINSPQEERKYGDHNERLLESIARMEQRNYGMLSTRPAPNPHLDSSLHGLNGAGGFDDTVRGGHLASGW